MIRTLAAALVVVGVLARFATVPATTEAMFPGTDGRIAYACGGSGKTLEQIYTADPDGTNATKLVPGRETSWSADGKKVAFYYFDGAGYPNIGIVNADGSGLRRPLAADVEQPSWSPDGKKLVTSLNDDGPYLVTVDTTSGATRKLAGPVLPRYPSWSPDGKSIAYSDAINGLSVIPAGGGTPRVIFADSGYGQLDWAPDGESIAFESSDGVWAVPAEGGDAVKIQDAPNGKVVSGFSYSPDGDHIILAAYVDSSSGFGLYVAPIGGTPKFIPTPGCDIPFAPSWQPVPSKSKIAGTITEVTCVRSSCKTKPLPGVKVTAKSSKGSTNATTNSRGKYEIKNLDADTYTVTPTKGTGAKKLEFDPEYYSFDLDGNRSGVDFVHCAKPPEGAADGEAPPPVPGGPCDKVIISGHVFDLDNHAYEDTCVTATRFSSNSGAGYVGSTNDDGFYAIEVRRGSYHVGGCTAAIELKPPKKYVVALKDRPGIDFDRLPYAHGLIAPRDAQVHIYQLPAPIRRGAYRLVATLSAGMKPGCIDSESVLANTTGRTVSFKIAEPPPGQRLCAGAWSFRVDREVDGTEMYHGAFMVPR